MVPPAALMRKPLRMHCPMHCHSAIAIAARQCLNAALRSGFLRN
jgi:hypothetical protein